MSRYELRRLLWSWGLMVDVGLSVLLVDGKPPDGIAVASRVRLVVAPSVKAWEGGPAALAQRSATCRSEVSGLVRWRRR